MLSRFPLPCALRLAALKRLFRNAAGNHLNTSSSSPFPSASLSLSAPVWRSSAPRFDGLRASPASFDVLSGTTFLPTPAFKDGELVEAALAAEPDSLFSPSVGLGRGQESFFFVSVDGGKASSGARSGKSAISVRPVFVVDGTSPFLPLFSCTDAGGVTLSELRSPSPFSFSDGSFSTLPEIFDSPRLLPCPRFRFLRFHFCCATTTTSPSAPASSLSASRLAFSSRLFGSSSSPGSVSDLSARARSNAAGGGGTGREQRSGKKETSDESACGSASPVSSSPSASAAPANGWRETGSAVTSLELFACAAEFAEEA
uniref:Uncharacterized protein n=1 Tax=Toxoplasma gondii TgCATBr9 TaxID=943120 RepID=A0A2T6IYZ2_TOXGO|nr:hypothetical protein TGBR9_356140 [Toxoplasma gondii TgCATBr9]